MVFNLRNGDWSDKSPLWTPDIRKELNPTLEENDGTFWMCNLKIIYNKYGKLFINFYEKLIEAYQDFIQHFRSLNICKVKNWDEVRIKGKFIRVQVNFYLFLI